MKYFVFAVVALGLVCIPKANCDCIHDEVMKTVVPLGVPQNYDTNERATSQIKPIRIFIDDSKLDLNTQPDSDYTCYSLGDTVTLSNGTIMTCGPNDVLTVDKRNYILNTMVAYAKETFEATLKVLSVSGNLILPSGLTNCYRSAVTPVTVPASYKSTGISNADVVVFLTARPITADRVLAFAGYCAYDSTTNRPIAGFLNIDPKNVNSTNKAVAHQQLGTGLHEMTHLLGFSYGAFSTFVDPSNGYNVLPLSSVVLNETVGSGPTLRHIIKIKTPTVVEKVREHLDCNDLNGAELEIQGDAASALTHWEKRLFMNEYMTSTSSSLPVFSAITLALLQDSGWYTVNFTAAQHLSWGYNQGCTFAEQNCSNWPRQFYFCDKYQVSNEMNTGCTWDRSAVGYCSFSTSLTNVPAYYQYFGNSYTGGTDTFADYCPYFSAFGNKACWLTQNSGTAYSQAGETYGDGSICMDSTLAKASSARSKEIQGCYETTCVGPDSLKVRVDGVWYDCPYGETAQIIDYGGVLTCPEESSSVCFGAAVDNSWPTFERVSPENGKPGITVTINGMVGFFGRTLSDSCTFVSDTEYKCKVPVVETGGPVSIVLADSQNRTAIGWDVFNIEVAASSASALSLSLCSLFILLAVIISS